MKTVVFGGTGAVGQIIVDKLVKQGQKVCVLTRQAKESNNNLQYVEGNVLDENAVENCIDINDHVIIALGFNNSDNDTMSRGTANIIKAMQSKGAKRIVCLSSHGVAESWNYLPLDFREMVLKTEVLKNAFDDHGIQEEFLKQSNLEWVIVRPTQIVDGSETGTYTVNSLGKDTTFKISRYDVAQFIIDEAGHPKHIHEVCLITD